MDNILQEHESGTVIIGTTFVPFTIKELQTLMDIDFNGQNAKVEYYLISFQQEAEKLVAYLNATLEPTLEGLEEALRTWTDGKPPFPAIDDIATVKLVPNSKDYPLFGFGGIPLNHDYILGNGYDLEYHRQNEYKIAKWAYENSKDLTVTFILKDN